MPPRVSNCHTIQLEPKDQPVLLAAINGEARYLITGDAEADRGRPGAETVAVLRTPATGLKTPVSPHSFGDSIHVWPGTRTSTTPNAFPRSDPPDEMR